MALGRRRLLIGFAAGAGGLALTGCGQREPAPPKPATIRFDPPPGAHDVDARSPGTVTVTDGTLRSVEWIDETGRSLPGAPAPDHRTWTSTEPLGYAHTYTAKAVAHGEAGDITATTTCTTVRPHELVDVSLRSANLVELAENDTYGVGFVLAARFDNPVDRAAAERHIAVTTQPAVTGAWYWLDDRNAHWRPEHYHAPGTRITVEANLFGRALGEGRYGLRDQRVSVNIGPAHVAIADDNTKQIEVFDNGNLVRTMPTSMGKGGTTVVGGRYLSFWTRPGIYTVLDRNNPVIMDSTTYGLPASAGGYRTSIDHAVRISHDGIFVHALAASMWAQGNTNVSHGCLNLSPTDAAWFYDFVIPGDVVEVRNTGGDPLDIWQNGDWSIPWSEWLRGGVPA
ncbi:Lipoprotein-anchoring transpeptidase ErfK/SrfK [Nocardia amikacinitolerans]|uniref:Lipoprotein-anchoring transpeptidase ErfK/SrfK n=1 Tax=Nocardia amikacinitolerans TaxID=756689 RepID=A0A285L5C5_9NOCA|nr:Ig-like domain-containing protein [Nocardia amikacinitolerans]MCP2296723.1 Lipoprotein-anchoring transpeptidase ErfK/SrfK [Nocardia amikacinitolerans]SNY78806.1 Lipoprotein-anchoring transpeptidase ErfK/SrfK [Nocardia amikacinitolerans]